VCDATHGAGTTAVRCCVPQEGVLAPFGLSAEQANAVIGSEEPMMNWPGLPAFTSGIIVA
jgi:hypothetical protein